MENVLREAFILGALDSRALLPYYLRDQESLPTSAPGRVTGLPYVRASWGLDSGASALGQPRLTALGILRRPLASAPTQAAQARIPGASPANCLGLGTQGE